MSDGKQDLFVSLTKASSYRVTWNEKDYIFKRGVWYPIKEKAFASYLVKTGEFQYGIVSPDEVEKSKEKAKGVAPEGIIGVTSVDGQPPMVATKETYMCEYCGKTFDSQPSLMGHRRSHPEYLEKLKADRKAAKEKKNKK